MAIKKGKYLNFGHSAHATNENDLTDVGLADLCVLHGLVARVDALLDQVANDRLELGAGELQNNTLMLK